MVDRHSIVAEIDSYIEWTPIFPLNQWWHFLLLVLVMGVVVTSLIRLAFLDRANQPLALVSSSILFRLSALLLLLIGFFGPSRHRQEIRFHPSRIAVILDTSSSMNLPQDATTGSRQRFDAARKYLEDHQFLVRLTKRHELEFFVLDDVNAVRSIGTIPYSGEQKTTSAKREPPRWLAILSISILGISVTSFFTAWLCQGLFRSILVLLGSITLIVTGFLFLWGDFQSSSGWFSTVDSPSKDRNTRQSARHEPNSVTSLKTAIEMLKPNTPTSPIGHAISKAGSIDGSRPLAAIILLSDGASNSGPGFNSIAGRLKQNRIPVFPVGFGDVGSSANVQIIELNVSPKVHLGDSFRITGKAKILAASLPASCTLRLESVGESDDLPAVEVERQTITFDRGTEVHEFQFALKATLKGKRRYRVSVEGLTEELDLSDNQMETLVEVVDDPIKVLLFAGGPSRDFRFLRNQLFQDPRTQLDVLLQTAEEGADQESDMLLNRFPDKKDKLFQYDCIVAFDPDWSVLKSKQSEWLREWVAEEACGLILIPGPVNTPIWTGLAGNHAVIEPIRKLYPVTFFNQTSGSIRVGRFGGPEAFPLKFSKVAMSFDFLNLLDSPQESRKQWDEIRVFGYYAVNKPKPGADVIAHFSDLKSSFNGKLPIYFASQLYGAGRVYFQASSEMWRTRSVGTEFFENYYTKLIRWTSQGRLLRDENGVTLSTDKNSYFANETATVKLVIRKAESAMAGIDRLPLSVGIPGDAASSTVIDLRRTLSSNQTSVFTGSFPANQIGRNVLQVTLPTVLKNQIVSREIQVKISNDELKNSERNDRDLQSLADRTDGFYLVPDASDQDDQFSEKVESLPGRFHQTRTPMSNDENWRRRLMYWLLGLTGLFLAGNWTIRRLYQLA